MSEHVTSEEVEQLSSGSLGMRRLAEVGAHLRSCAACTSAVESIATKRVAALRSSFDDQHASYEDLAALVDGSAAGERADDVLRHLGTCATCREEADDLRALRVPPPLRRRATRVWAIAAGIALLLAAAALLLFVRRDSEPRVVQTPPPPPRTAPPRVADPTVTTAPQPVAGEYGRADWNDWVRDAVTSRRLDMPAVLRELRPASMAVRGTQSDPPRTPSVGSPTGEVLRNARPELVWSRPPRATSIVLIHGSHGLAAASKPLEGDRWTPPGDLRRGETYTWQVTITRESGESLVIPAPPAPPALFRILGETENGALAEAERAHGGDDLLLAVLYARHGLRREALAALERHAARHPSATADALLRSVRSWPAE